MSEQTKKRPAHEVLLSKLKELADEYRGVVREAHAGDPAPEFLHGSKEFLQIAQVLARMGLVMEVLMNMVIPEKEFAKVIDALAELSVLDHHPVSLDGKLPARSPAWAVIHQGIAGLKS